MYKNLLVPISFDEDRNPNEALDDAKALCAEGGTITLLHVLEALPQYATEYLTNDFQTKARDNIRDALTGFSDGSENMKIEVVEGHSGRTILDWAEANKVDCIVIASHRPGLQDYFLGSTAARVVRHASCAVHVVR